MMADHAHIRGLHHVTAIASGAQANVDFYTRVLGLRLVKRTYEGFGDEAGRQRFRARGGGPAAFVDLLCRPELMRGRMGAGHRPPRRLSRAR
jgi:glyoxalase family protein